MDVLLGILAVAVGVLAGLVGYDLRARGIALAKVMAAEGKLELAARAMADTHNSLAQRMLELGDRVQAHELKLSGIGSEAKPFHPFPGKLR